MEILPKKYFSIGVSLLVLLTGCAGRSPAPQKNIPDTIRAAVPPQPTQPPYQIDGTWYYPIPSAEGFIEEGKASYYGAKFNGKRTANGERVVANDMTAAHKTLPMGTYVKVVNLANHRSTIVRINDRGPFVKGRVIDVSRKAAEKLGLIEAGVAAVRIEAVHIAKEQQLGRETYWTIEPAPTTREGNFTVQVGAFREMKNANRLKDKIGSQYAETQVRPFYYRGVYFYRVQLGSYDDLVKALGEMEKLRQQGFKDAIVVGLEENYRAEKD